MGRSTVSHLPPLTGKLKPYDYLHIVVKDDKTQSPHGSSTKVDIQSLREALYYEGSTALAEKSGSFSYTWASMGDGDQFRVEKKKIYFPQKLSEKPNEIIYSNLVTKNCSAFKIKKITKDYFMIQVTLIKATENKLEFDWEAQ